MPKSQAELESIIGNAVETGKTISLKTYFLSDYGENILNLMTSTILKKFNRMDLMEISYTSAKELVINATKANLKRVLYKQLDLDIRNPEHYEKGVKGVSVSGIAFEVMQEVDMVSKEFKWDLGSGYCGKGQPAKVDAGGPYIRTKVRLGGTKD